MKFSEIVSQVIDLADAANQAYAKRRGQLPDVIDLVAAYNLAKNPSEEEQALQNYLNRLPAATIYLLTAIMYIGRDDDPQEGFDMLDHYQDMSDTFDKPQHAVSQMTEKVPFPDYLRNGVRILRQRGRDIDFLC